jgi:hypothetical protein
MNLTFSMANAIGALGIIGALLMVARAVGKWEQSLQDNLKSLVETQGKHDARIAVVESEVGEIMNHRRWVDENDDRRTA